MKELVLKAECPHGPGEIRVKLVADHYVGGNKLYLALWELTDDGPEPYGDLTKCLEGNVPADCAYVDTNNVPQAEQFIIGNGLGTFTHMVGHCGGCTYPLYHFDMGRVKEFI